VNTQRIKALIKKELKRVIREPANLFLIFIFPLILTLAFGLAFGAIGSGGDIQYTVGVVDDDASGWSMWFQGNITRTGALTVVVYEDQVSAYADLQTGGVSAVLVIPEGFGASIEGFLIDPDSSSWHTSTLVLALDQGSMIVGSIVPAFIQQSLTTTMYGEEALSPPSPVVIGAPTLVDPVKLTQFDYMVPGMFSYSAIFISLIVAQVLTEERTTGILDRIATTPTTTREMFTSLILANLVIGIVQVLVVLGSSYVMGFRPQGGLTGTLVGLVAVLLLVITNVGFGLLTASISKTSSAATGIGFIFILPQMFLGSFVPAPESVSRLVPSYYATETIKNVFLRGAEASSLTVLNNLVVLTVYTLAVASLGVFIFSRYGRR
jgi:ABC-2 type transport system permease protein